MVVKGSSISSSLIKSANDGGSSGGVIRILGIPDNPVIDPLDVTVDAGGKGTRNSGELEFI